MDSDIIPIKATDMATLDDLRRELHDITAAAAAAAAQIAEVKRGTASMAERFAAAPWGTAGLGRAIDALADIVGALPALDDVDDATSVVNVEISATGTLVEAVEALGATGNVDAFKAV